jgi:peptide/nickel transport system permease protein
MKLRFEDDQGRWHLRPFVYLWMDGENGTYQVDASKRYPLRFFVDGDGYRILGLLPSQIHLVGVESPGRLHLLGTDTYGRDYLSRLLFGGGISLAAGLCASTLSLCVALMVGGLSGYFGGWVDEILMRISDLFLALPWLYLLFAARAALPLDLGPGQTFLLLVSLLGLVGWARPMRLVRGIVLAAKTREFVSAGRSFGASHIYILRRHILPQTRGIVLTQASLLVPLFILAEVTLSFVGLGISEPLPSWGNMLSSLQQYYILSRARWMFAPGIALVVMTWLYHSLLSSLQREPLKSQI